MHSPRGPPRLGRSRFFCLLYLNNYSKIFQKRRIVKLLLGVTQVGYPLGGAPWGPWGPFRGPRVSPSSGKNCKNSQKLYKKLSCIKIPQIISLTSILSHLGNWGGALGGQNVFLAGRGGFSEARAFIFFLNVLYWSTAKFWGGDIVKF